MGLPIRISTFYVGARPVLDDEGDVEAVGEARSGLVRGLEVGGHDKSGKFGQVKRVLEFYFESLTKIWYMYQLETKIGIL